MSSPLVPSHDRVQTCVAVAATFIALPTVALCLRIVARKLQTVSWIWADIVIVVAWLFTAAECALSIVEAKLIDLPPGSSIPVANQILLDKLSIYVEPTIYVIGVNLPKLVILDLYRRVFVDATSKFFIYVAQFIIIAAIITLPIVLLTTICQPLSYLWDPSTPGGWCKYPGPLFTAGSAFNIATDVVVLVLPIPMIHKLKVSRGQKLGLAFTFACGSAGLVTAIIRLVAFRRSISSPSTLYQGYDLLIWTCAEMGVYFICACVITYRPLCRWIWLGCPLSALSQGLDSYLSAYAATHPTREHTSRSNGIFTGRSHRLGSEDEHLRSSIMTEASADPQPKPPRDVDDRNSGFESSHAIYVQRQLEMVSERGSPA